jgi:imidazolonepropionase-like amidohydrolase
MALRTRSIFVTAAWLCACAAHGGSSWVLDGNLIYRAPDAPPERNARIVIKGGTIASIGRASSHTKGASIPECNGGVLVAGFQNSHVHLLGDDFLDAAHQSAAALTDALARMLTRYGYTTVFDIASDRDNTLALRARIANGEVQGPRILTAGLPLFPPNGLPGYIAGMRKELLDKFPQPDTVNAALDALRGNFSAGVDATKLFLATPQADHSYKRMPPDIALAAVAETHRHGKLVFAHPSDFDGIRAALAAHVDILAHPPFSAPAPWPTDLMNQVRDAQMWMIPTIKLLQTELVKEQAPPDIAKKVLDDGVIEFGKFVASGGKILFGTDVGYMTDYDPTVEYQLMAKAGMTPMQILASLTTSPATRWNEATRRGRLARGMDADIVVLEADPAIAPENFAKVKCVVRGGEVIYKRR